MKKLKRLYYRLFPTYKRLELKYVSWDEGDKMIKGNEGKPEYEQWVIAKEEDKNRIMLTVFLERRKRITE